MLANEAEAMLVQVKEAQARAYEAMRSVQVGLRPSRARYLSILCREAGT